MTNFDKLAESYDKWYKTPKGIYLDKLEKEAIFRLAKPKKEETALDVGCGTGNYTFWLSRMGVKVTGIDISREMIDVAKKKIGSREDIRFVVGDAEALPFDSGVFDLALAVATLEFVNNPQRVVKEMFRVVNSEGGIVIGAFNRHSPWACWRRIRGIFRDSIYNQAQFYSLSDLRNLIGINKKLEEVVVSLASQNKRSYLPRTVLGRRFGGFIAARAGKA